MSSAPEDDLRRMLATRTASAIEAARRAGGDVPRAEMETLEHLARLLQLRKLAGEAPPRRSWQIAAILIATLALVSLLFFARVRRTDVELEVEATQVSLSIPTEQILFENLDLSVLGVSGLSRIRLPDAIAAELGTGLVAEPDSAIRLAVADVNGRRGAVSIAEIKPARGTTLDLRVTGTAGHFRLSLQDPGIPIDVGVLGPVSVAIAGVGSKLIDLPVPQGLVLEPAAGSLDLDVTFRDLEHAAMTPQVPVSRLEFWRVDEFGDRRISVLRTLSTILGGTIYFEALNGARRPLRAGEVLRFGRADGEVRTLRLRNDRLSLGFHGRVQGMSTGSESSVRSLMPTWLDWLRAQHGLSLLWGTTIYLAGLAMAVLRWYKGSV